jgi:hypothetical protein
MLDRVCASLAEAHWQEDAMTAARTSMLVALALVAAAASPVRAASGFDADLPAPPSAKPSSPQPSFGAPAQTVPHVTGRFGLKSYDVSDPARPRSPGLSPNALRHGPALKR